MQSLVQCVVQLLVQLLKQFCKFHEFVNFVRICSSSSSREMIFSLRCPVIQGDNLVHEDTCCKGSIVSVCSSGSKRAVGRCMCFRLTASVPSADCSAFTHGFGSWKLGRVGGHVLNDIMTT
jgi:hypothetical protein